MAGPPFPVFLSTNTDSNMERLLSSLTPKVPLTRIPANCIQDFNRIWNPTPKPMTTYFTLRDLWLSFEQWSAYGAKTKVTVENKGDVDQFFVPSLSAIQIFTNKPHESIRHPRKKMSFQSLYFNTNDLYPQSDEFYSKPYFEFNEKVSPYNRHPLFDTIEKLSISNPALQTLTSIDLAPASWMCVAWYPMCQIPNIGIPIKDFHAAFLTFHSLSSFYQDTVEEDNRSISLKQFGCATYKLEGDIWLNHGPADYLRLCNLHNAAESWLTQLNFEHNDFKFFARQGGHQHVAYAQPPFCYYFDNSSGFLPFFSNCF
ncbi:hypothetical protein POM88_016388 [Heracleum sosnowskyi]|uniref:Uncharacterized protein n=1 Tax=Heracleum sosnowskyi TaxID=360622 RepID=A0AAD8IQI2_9APIA|nr:hypothetical protein POM88_016388 [Heracleum sosnowskyi]